MMKKIFGLASVLLLIVVALAVSAFAQPTLPSIGDKTVNEGQLLQFTGTLTAAPDSGGSIFGICNAGSATGACIGAASMTLAGTTANITNLSSTQFQFNWTPSFAASGVYFVNLSVRDGDSTDNETFRITVADVPPSFTATNLALGSKSQERSNPNSDTERKQNVNVSGVVTITNSGGETVKNLKFDKVTGLSKYSSAFSNAKSFGVALAATELAPGASTTATVILRVPENLDAVNSNGEQVAFDVAQLTFTGTKSDGVTALSPVTSTVSMTAENNLRFKSAKALFDSKSLRIDDDDTIDNVRPGTRIEIEFEVESRFKDDDAVDIEDVVLVAESTGDTDDLDVDEDVDIDSLGPEDVEITTVAFEVEPDAARGKESMIVTLDGIDENGARHGEKFDLTIDIERKDHEISILSATLTPRSVSCEASSDLSVKMRNTGRRDEDQVFLRVFSTELNNFNRNVEIGTLDENDEETRSFTVPVPVDLAAGTYRLTVETYYDVGTKSNTDAAILTKAACAKEQPPEKDEGDKPVIVITPSPEKNQTPVVTPPAPEAKGFLDSTAFIALLVLGYVAVLGGGSMVLIKLLRK